VAGWEAQLERHQQLWDHLDDLDDHCIVLEPERSVRARHVAAAAAAAAAAVGPSEAVQRPEAAVPPAEAAEPGWVRVVLRAPRRLVHRRVALAPHASVLLELDPARPRAHPPAGCR